MKCVNLLINIVLYIVHFADNPCVNGGLFKKQGDDYTCDCSATGYAGDHCHESKTTHITYFPFQTVVS